MEPNPRAGSSIFLNQHDFDPEITEVKRVTPLRVVNASERPVPLIAVLFSDGTRAQQTHALDRPLIVGRARSCEIVVGEKVVSREHARLTPVGNSIEVKDLGSRNGTFVDGQRITSALAGAGSVIGIGDTVLCLRAAPSPSSPVADGGRRADIEVALRNHGGNVRRASQALGIARSHVYRLVDRFGINVAQFRG